jgi:hypothetical protein
MPEFTTSQLKRIGGTMLKDDAQARFDNLVGVAHPENRLYQAGWDNGEWTCCECGGMIGKNLNGVSPYALARQHAAKCEELNHG